MNNVDSKVLSRATIQLVLDNQKLTEKLNAKKLESKKYKKRVEDWQKKWQEENQNAVKLENFAVALFSKFDIKCACEEDSDCENSLCAKIATIREKIKEEVLKEMRVGEQESEDSSSDSSSDSD